MPDINTLEYLIVTRPAALAGFAAAAILAIFAALPALKVLGAALGMIFAVGFSGIVTL